MPKVKNIEELYKFGSHDIKQCLESDEVCVLKASAKKWKMCNSVAFTIPPLLLRSIFGNEYESIADLKASINYIFVDGERPDDEELHYHTSQIVGIVTHGVGYVDHILDTREVTTQVTEGDIVIIPDGALHTFHSKNGEKVGYAVLELGSKLDGQKHHY